MIEITQCPECDQVAEVTDRHVLESTHGPVEHVKVVCLARHWFLMPVARLEPAPAAAVRAAESLARPQRPARARS